MEKLRVLVAEDFDVLREDICEIVETAPDMTVVASVSTGKAVVEKYRELLPDVVLMDIEMESMDAGIRAAEVIVAENPDALVIYLTSHESDDIIITAMATGAVDYIVKGSGPETIRDHIRAAVHGEGRLDSRIQQVVMGEYKRLRKNEQNLLFFIQKLGSLTPVERELVGYLLKGFKVKDIAAARNVEIVTVKSQIRTLLQKAGCTRTREVVKLIEELDISHLFV